MILAKGIKNDKEMTVEYRPDRVLFNGHANKMYEEELSELLESRPSIFGTYYAGAPYEDLNIIGVLREYFFDNPALVTSDEEISVPDWEEGRVY